MDSIKEQSTLFKRPKKASALFQHNLPKTCFIFKKPKKKIENYFKSKNKIREDTNNAFDSQEREDFAYMAKKLLLCLI